MEQHTKGPWEVGQRFPDTIYDENAEVIAKCYSISAVNADESNARRIVACVNACEGVDTGLLENNPAPFSELRSERDYLAAQNATLLAALKINHQWHIDNDEYDDYLESDLLEINTAAITNAEKDANL